MAEATKDERTLILDDKTYNVSDFSEDALKVYNKLALLDQAFNKQNNILIEQSLIVEGLAKERADQVEALKGMLPDEQDSKDSKKSN